MKKENDKSVMSKIHVEELEMGHITLTLPLVQVIKATFSIITITPQFLFVIIIK